MLFSIFVSCAIKIHRKETPTGSKCSARSSKASRVFHKQTESRFQPRIETVLYTQCICAILRLGTVGSVLLQPVWTSARSTVVEIQK